MQVIINNYIKNISKFFTGNSYEEAKRKCLEIEVVIVFQPRKDIVVAILKDNKRKEEYSIALPHNAEFTTYINCSCKDDKCIHLGVLLVYFINSGNIISFNDLNKITEKSTLAEINSSLKILVGNLNYVVSETLGDFTKLINKYLQELSNLNVEINHIDILDFLNIFSKLKFINAKFQYEIYFKNIAKQIFTEIFKYENSIEYLNKFVNYINVDNKDSFVKLLGYGNELFSDKLSDFILDLDDSFYSNNELLFIKTQILFKKDQKKYLEFAKTFFQVVEVRKGYFEYLFKLEKYDELLDMYSMVNNKKVEDFEKYILSLKNTNRLEDSYHDIEEEIIMSRDEFFLYFVKDHISKNIYDSFANNFLIKNSSSILHYEKLFESLTNKNFIFDIIEKTFDSNSKNNLLNSAFEYIIKHDFIKTIIMYREFIMNSIIEQNENTYKYLDDFKNNMSLSFTTKYYYCDCVDYILKNYSITYKQKIYLEKDRKQLWREII